MPDVVCNTSPLQYLHQLGLAHVLQALAGAGRVIVPRAVADELDRGRARGADVPDARALEGIEVREPASAAALPLVTDLGSGEVQVLALGLEVPGAIVVLDDKPARRIARMLGLPHTGTLGLLLDAKHAGLVAAVAPLLERLEGLGFRIDAATRRNVLERAGELPAAG